MERKRLVDVLLGGKPTDAELHNINARFDASLGGEDLPCTDRPQCGCLKSGPGKLNIVEHEHWVPRAILISGLPNDSHC